MFKLDLVFASCQRFAYAIIHPEENVRELLKFGVQMHGEFGETVDVNEGAFYQQLCFLFMALRHLLITLSPFIGHPRGGYLRVASVCFQVEAFVHLKWMMETGAASVAPVKKATLTPKAIIYQKNLLSEFSVVPATFGRKKEAEQSAAEMALQKKEKNCENGYMGLSLVAQRYCRKKFYDDFWNMLNL
ncbi:hypothetical protein Ancab_019108 [Ancistrocladus abbreviatus]